jgi:formamidopyrimidine-DNA glycosylase
MPELPEVETTKRGISPHLTNKKIEQVVIRNHQLRWPIDEQLPQILAGQTIHTIERRAKYLLLKCDTGTLLIHLGMSGRLAVLDQTTPVQKHDHVDISVSGGLTLRYTDPRRFGAVLWTTDNPNQHALLNHLGPEPLSDEFNANYLASKIKTRKTAIKTVVMNGEIVVGVGNIYANEALFLAGVHPERSAHSLSEMELELLTTHIKAVLTKAIEAGGTTLKDFRKSDGKPGYFAQQLHVYGRAGEACTQCGGIIESFKQAQRASYCCPLCQSMND